jgi:hypothetical protein
MQPAYYRYAHSFRPLLCRQSERLLRSYRSYLDRRHNRGIPSELGRRPCDMSLGLNHRTHRAADCGCTPEPHG